MATETKLPPVYCSPIGVDGNAFSVMGHWQSAAEEAGWPEDEIKRVLDDAMSGNYQHLLKTIIGNCTKPKRSNR